MIRWVAVLSLLTGLCVPAAAQVFKPKTGTTSTSSKSTSSKSTSSKSTSSKSGSKAKKSSASTGHKTAARKKKRSSAASKGRPSDLTPDDAPKVDPDYVKIIDDDE